MTLARLMAWTDQRSPELTDAEKDKYRADSAALEASFRAHAERKAQQEHTG